MGLSRDLPDSPVLTAVWAQGLWGTHSSGCLAPGFLGCQSCQAVAFRVTAELGREKLEQGHRAQCSYRDSALLLFSFEFFLKQKLKLFQDFACNTVVAAQNMVNVRNSGNVDFENFCWFSLCFYGEVDFRMSLLYHFRSSPHKSEFWK